MALETIPIGGSGSLLRTDASGRLSARRYTLEVVSGPDAGREAVLERTLVVGTQSDAGLRLSDPHVSRSHLELIPRGDGVLLRDLQSRNGTSVRGLRATEVFVEDEVSIVVGHTELRLRIAEDAVAVPEGRTSLGPAIAASPVMQRLLARLETAAASDGTILLLGETGTGKEVLAEAIHQSSPRRDRPLVVFDCGAVAPNLIESELFGHVRGAFTGAISDHDGAFLEADGGTLFFDEIGELPLELQPRLLRALEAGTIRRVGEVRPRRVDVRIIAATHQNLAAQVKAGRFRQDLYYRLAVLEFQVPPLRERPEDIPLLARHFLRQLRRLDFELSPQLLDELRAYDWPGNVRELRNAVQRSVAGATPGLPHRMRRARTPVAAERSGDPDLDLPFKEAKQKIVDDFSRDYLVALHARCNGNISQMARTAGIARNYVQKLVKKFGLNAVED